MTAKLLNEEEVKFFTKETGIRAKKILLLKENKSYYIIIMDNVALVKIPNKLAKKILECCKRTKDEKKLSAASKQLYHRYHYMHIAKLYWNLFFNI